MPQPRTRDDDAQPPGASGDLRERAERAERERDHERRERERLQRENDRLRRELERVKRQLDEARRAAHRQAAPFAKALTAHPRRPGRKAGARYGVKAHRRRPHRIDERHEAPLPAACPDCRGPLRATRIATQYQEELPVPRVVVRQFRIHIGHCRACGRRVQGRHPLQTSDALGAASAQLGAQAIAFAVILNKQLGLSFGKIATLLRQQYGLTVTRSGLVHAVHRAARQAQPTYAALGQQIRGSPVVTPDETGWKVGGRLHWLWAVATPDTTVYAIQRGRGYPEAATLLGEDFAGVIVRDGWAPYRRFTLAMHQTCLAHLLRRSRELLTDHPRATFVTDVRTILQQALQLRDRHLDDRVSVHGLAVARGHLIERLNRRLERPGAISDVRRFAAHLAVEWPALFTFLFEPTTIDATNWRAEQALRPAVVTRKVCGGNRSPVGAQTQQILASVLRTAQQRQLNPHAVLVSMLCARTPIVPVALRDHTR
ncbi:MAG: IS66 family transposase [Pseudomonadota bacterium]